MPAKKKNENTPIEITAVDRGQVTAFLVGETPLICNRLSEKARHELLYPKKKTAADKASSLKHDPMQEFRSSPYTDPNSNAPTLIQVLGASIKHAAASVVRDLPDTATSMAQLRRLMFVQAERVHVYGVPQMLMSPVRSAGMNRTPDIRTRAILPKWAIEVTITFTKPILTKDKVVRLLANAGFMVGIGDWRPEKGSGEYGSFHLVNDDDPELRAIMASGGRAAQVAALESPEFYDEETRDIYEWFAAEVERRGQQDTKKAGRKKAAKAPSKGNGASTTTTPAPMLCKGE